MAFSVFVLFFDFTYACCLLEQMVHNIWIVHPQIFFIVFCDFILQSFDLLNLNYCVEML